MARFTISPVFKWAGFTRLHDRPFFPMRPLVPLATLRGTRPGPGATGHGTHGSGILDTPLEPVKLNL